MGEATATKEIEVRHATLADGRLEFDEVVARDACVHLEKMNESCFCLIVETRRELACFNIFTKNGRAHIDANTSWHDPINRRSEGQKRRWSQLSQEQRRRRKR